MALRGASMILVAAQAVAAQAGAEDTGRDLLFTDPTAALPDVYISQSVMYLAEGETFGYTVELTHQPGVREDETVDLQNDEVRIYLTSSQEVYQQDDESSSSVQFQQRVGHRTQLTINTNVKEVTLGADLKVASLANDVTAYNTHDIDVVHAEDPRVEGPTPYVYVRYSTVNPGQASPVVSCPAGDVLPAACPAGCTSADPASAVAVACTGADFYEVVCPLCSHEAYCTHTTGVIAGTAVCVDPEADPYKDADTAACTTDLDDGDNATATDSAVKFEGCYDIVYNGFAPVYDACSENGALMRYGAAQDPVWDGASGDAIEAVQEVYVGYAVLAEDEDTAASVHLLAWDAPELSRSCPAGNVSAADCPVGCNSTADPGACTGAGIGRLKLRGEKASNEPATDTSGGYNFQPIGEPNGPAPGIPYGDQTMKAYGCYPRVLDFDGEAYTDSAATVSIIRRARMGGEDPAWLTHEECWDKIRGVWSDCAGNMEAVPSAGAEPVATDGIAGQSDFRIRADGSPVLRDIPRVDDYCRYCDKPGLFCDVDRKPDGSDSDADPNTWHPLYEADAAAAAAVPRLTMATPHAAGAGLPSAANTLRGRECIKDTVNGGDTAPNSPNWLEPGYISGPSWRGDLSSGAQLVFDSTNWDTPQTVLVTARDDDVYEPNVFGRGQDAYVHHYVVAQDINLQHTYYEDIDVNDVVVSITDNDPAYVLQHDEEIEPVEGQSETDAPELRLRLASEPMYDVTIYVQSGSFLDASGGFLPDDEQVVFQDAGQYAVCFDEETGLRAVTDTAASSGAVGGSQANDCSNDGHVANGAVLCPAGDVAAAACPVGCISAADPGACTPAADYEDHGYAGRFRLRACDISGHYVTPESYKDATDSAGTNYKASEAYELPTGWSCNSYTTEAACLLAIPAAGCAWEDEDYIWTECDCVGYNDHPTGGTDAVGADAGVDFGSVDASSSDGFMTGDDANTGTRYPVCVAAGAGDQAVCEDVDAAARIWDATDGCIDVTTGGPAERKNDGYGTDTAGTGETPAMTENQCIKTGNTFGNATGAGFCTTKQGSLVPDLITAATCVGVASANNTVGSSVEMSDVSGGDANQNPTTRGSCVEALQVTSQDLCSAADSADACAGLKHCMHDGTDCVKRTNFNAASKSMDLVCATYATSGDCDTEGCTWDRLAAGGDGLCKAEKLGYDCNSYLTFTSTNWNSWQTLKVIAVDDDEDETVARPAGFDPSDIGYLIASRDWYYNSAGSKDVEGKRADLTAAMAATWSPGTAAKDVSRYGATIDISMFDTRFGVHINRYPWPSNDDNELAAGTVDCHAQTDTDFVGDELLAEVLPSPQNGFLMSAALDRLGDAGADNVGRYGTTRRFVHNENGVSAWLDPLGLPVEQMKLYGVSTAGGHVDTPVGYTSEPKHNCKLKAPHAKDAGNQVCLGDTEATWAAQMVTSFAPPSTLGATCGATSKVTDTNIRQVTISRGFCQATEGRRFFYRDFMHQVNPTTSEWTGHVRGSQRAEAPSKLVTTLGQVKAAAEDLDDFPTYLSAATNADTGEPADLWTSAYVRPDVVEALGTNVMTMPTCPFTIKLETAPREGATVVVEVFEDPDLVAMRDNELYFYEEPTFRPGVASQYECEMHFPGSKWIANHDGDNPVQGTGELAEHAYRLGAYTSDDGSCFIQNVPYVEPADPTDVFLGLGFQPRGGTSLEVMFTAADWDVPRRITAIALNDDVDEPDEYRGIFFNTKGSCNSGYNHNQGTVLVATDSQFVPERLACVEDPLYNDAVISTIQGDNVDLSGGRDEGPKDSITVQVIDDDIADLVVLCGDNPSNQDECTAEGTAVTAQADCDALPGCAWSPQAGTDAGRCLFNYEDDEQFIGSYDDSHPHNRWDEGVERRGANAEDGMSYSKFGGGISTLTDGITGSAGADESCDNCGYVSIVKSEGMTSERCVTRTITPNTLNTLTQDETWAQDFEEGCYPDTQPLDKLCVAVDPTNAADDATCSALVLDVDFDTNCAALAECTLVASAGAQVGGYDPYTDQWCVDSPSSAIADTWDADTGLWSHAGTQCGTYVNIANHVRGFKGAGPAFTEDTDAYACTIHSRECHDDDGTLTDSEGAACTYGTFKIRLNSSPGVKKVKRHYTGSTVTETEAELVYVVVTPDETPQTSFSPASVTFTETGGLVNGVATQRWDHPIEIQVVPKDDDVDERMGVIVDFTAFSIQQSHFYDEYWKYTVPYMNLDAPTYPFTGKVCAPKTAAYTDAYDWNDCEGGKNDATEGDYNAVASSGRIDGHTAYRHTIRTIHTMDNDYSGVRLQSGSVAQTKDSTANTYSHDPIDGSSALTAIEGGTFAWYSLVLDTKPHKVQRQTGTNPNKVLVHDPTNCADQADSDAAVFNVADFFGDYTDATRPDVCGSVEPPADYWVDVTVTQTIHVDLAEPASCPVTAPWGGGSTPPTTIHPRFPFSGKLDSNDVAQPFDVLVDRAGDMDGYLSTCGGWQRDATYRFTADNWNIPQFVYLYAHDDRDAANAASGATGDDYVRRGGNELFDEGETYYTTTLKHYVETEDTLDNIEATDEGNDKFVQWNKHGGIYTFGNIERFPFGHDRTSRMTNTEVWGCPEDRIAAGEAYLLRYASAADAEAACPGEAFLRKVKYGALDETGYTTWGYSKYESLYGYGYFKEGVWTTEGCCSTNMGGAWGAYTAGIGNWGTEGGLGGTDSNDNGAEFRTARSDITEQPPDPLGRFVCSFARPGSGAGYDVAVARSPYTDSLAHVGTPCVEKITSRDEPRPYNHEGEFCTPTVETSPVASDVLDAANTFQFCLPRFATSYQTYYDPVVDETDRSTGVALKFPPTNVEVRVSDNDAMADQVSADVARCKQTQFVMWSDAENPLMTDSTGVDTSRSAWLLDYNCEPSSSGAGNAGGLPGYPTSRDADGTLTAAAGEPTPGGQLDPTGR